ncbi:MAG: DnaJ domain-containing protein [Nitrospirota bacterium]
MDRFDINDTDKQIVYDKALKFIGEVRAGISWERFRIYALYYFDAFIDMLNDTEDVRKYLSLKNIEKKYVFRHVRDILYRLHFNREDDYYLTLGLPCNATDSRIRKRWKDLMLLYHPDRLRDDSTYSTECAKKINEAYGVLKDRAKRMEYDRKTIKAVVISQKSVQKKPRKATKTKRFILVSPLMRRSMGRLVTLSCIIIPFLILLIIFLENRSSKLKIQQLTVSNKTYAPAKAVTGHTTNKEEDLQKVNPFKGVEEQKAEGHLRKNHVPENNGLLKRAQRKNQRYARTFESYDDSVPNIAEEEGSPDNSGSPSSRGKEDAARNNEQTEVHEKASTYLVSNIPLKNSDEKEQPGLKSHQYALSENLEKEVNLFIGQYIRAYEEGDIDKFMQLYSKSALENSRLRYNDISRAYKKNFEGNRYKYFITNVQFRKKGENIVVTGQYIITKLKDDTGSFVKGEIIWTLSREEGKLKIVKVEYA